MFLLNCVLFNVFFALVAAQNLAEGDQCLLSDGTQGICKFVTTCQPALELLLNGIFPENLCGVLGTQSMFCCKDTGSVTNPTPLPTLTGRQPGEISRQMCKKYAEYVPDSYECTFATELNTDSVIATRQEFPHMVMLGYVGRDSELIWQCGGSLISEQFVLAAAHCLARKDIPVAVRIGVTNLNDTDHLQDIKINELIIHPQYTLPQHYNDIGLVRLEKKIHINDYARPACLFTKKEIGVEKAISSGWGSLSFAGAFDDRLQKLTLEIYTEEKCNNTYTSNRRNLPKGITYDTMVCAGTKSIVTTQPQTGGPLQILHKEDGPSNFKCISDIVGISSFGRSGIAKDIPDVYTRVSAFIPWIEDNVWN